MKFSRFLRKKISFKCYFPFYGNIIKKLLNDPRETFLETRTANKYTYEYNLKYSKKVSKSGNAEVLNRASFEKGETERRRDWTEGDRKGKDLWENVGAVEASRRRKQEANK